MLSECLECFLISFIVRGKVLRAISDRSDAADRTPIFPEIPRSIPRAGEIAEALARKKIAKIAKMRISRGEAPFLATFPRFVASRCVSAASPMARSVRRFAKNLTNPRGRSVSEGRRAACFGEPRSDARWDPLVLTIRAKRFQVSPVDWRVDRTRR